MGESSPGVRIPPLPPVQYLAKAAIWIWILVLGYFVWNGVTTEPWEGDSLAYHIPIARNILEGKWGQFDNLLEYYPAAGEMILAGFIRLGIPLNLYNVAGWVVLFLVCRRLGGNLFAAAVCLWPSVVRLIPTQTVDIWLAVFWAGSFLMLERKDWVGAGVVLGLLMGVKYSGVGYAGVLIAAALVFGKIDFRKLLVVIGVMVLVGGFWYARNYWETGLPFYPAGDSAFKMTEKRSWMIVTNYPARFVEAIISEYLLWPLVGLLVVVRNFIFNSKINRLLFLAGGNFLVYLFVPAGVENIVSDLRYIFPVMIPLTWAVFEWARERGGQEKLGMLAVLAMAVEMTQLDFRPKLFVIVLMTAAVWLFGLKRLFRWV